MEMKVCPLCQRVSSNSAELFCEMDGTPLIVRLESSELLTDEVSPASLARRPVPLSRETMVGLGFVLVIVAIIGVFLLHRHATGFHIDVAFDSGNKLKVGDPVYLRGKEVGEVAATEFRKGKFVATLSIRPEDAEYLRQDSLFYIANDKLFLGKKCVLIYVLNLESPALVSGDAVVGVDSWFDLQRRLIGHWGKKKAEEINDTLRKRFD